MAEFFIGIGASEEPAAGHRHIAVEPPLEGQAAACVTEVIHQYYGKDSEALFAGMQTLHPDGAAPHTRIIIKESGYYTERAADEDIAVLAGRLAGVLFKKGHTVYVQPSAEPGRLASV